MAKIEIDEAAFLLAQKRAHEAKLKNPIFFVSWWKGLKDNFRSDAGGVVWKTIHPEGWSAGLLENLEPGYSLPVPTPTFEIHGLRIWTDEKVRLASGILQVGVRDGGFIVTHVVDN